MLAGRLAPSAVNFQPCHFIVITDKDIKSKVAEAYSRQWFQSAPVIIAACGIILNHGSEKMVGHIC